MRKSFVSKSEKETFDFGRRLGRILTKGSVVALCGELASGKTVLAKGIAEGLGVKSGGYVNSPSFVILKEYKGRLPLYHFDLYRVTGPDGLSGVDYKGYFYGYGVSVIEWADRIPGLMPEDFLRVDISVGDKNERRISLVPRGVRHERLTEGL